MDVLFTGQTADFCRQLMLACLLGGLIGIERTLRSKEAGPRTHCLISLAAALFTLLSKYAFLDFISPGEGGGVDGTMMVCQIVNGVNFLGAGLIFKSNRYGVRGLTTATGIWFTAAVGMACGSGLEAMAVYSAAFIVALQFFLRKMQIGSTNQVVQELRLTLLNTPHIRRVLRRQQRAYGMEIISAKIERMQENQLDLSLQVRTEKLLTFKEALHLLDQYPEIKGIST